MGKSIKQIVGIIYYPNLIHTAQYVSSFTVTLKPEFRLLINHVKLILIINLERGAFEQLADTTI